MRWIFRNWELKLAAVGLSTVLYTGLVFSGSFTESRLGSIPIQRTNQPNGAYVITQELPPVEVHYRESREATTPVSTDSFAATVDLSQYDMTRAGQPQSLQVQLRSLENGVTWIDFRPTQVTITMDVLDTRSVPVVIDRGEVPSGLELGPPTLSDSRVQARGPRSLLNQVARAVAHVSIDASGIDFSGQVRLTPVDANGTPIDSVELTPDVVSIQIPVTTQETNKTVAVRPALTGTPAAGFEVSQIAVDPAVIAIRGTPSALGQITEIATDGFSVEGLTASKTFSVKLVLPPGTRLQDESITTVKVTVGIQSGQGSRTLVVGVRCVNVPSGTTCLPQVGQISMTLAGPLATLAGLKPAAVTPVVDASGLAPGSHDLSPAVTLPSGVSLVGFSPAKVTVVIAAASPNPTAGP